MSPPENGICSAIKSRKLVGFEYPEEGSVYHHRSVEPYAHGVSPQGEEVLYGYQVAGTSETLETLPGWRVFAVSKMRDLEVLERGFPGNASGREHASRYIASLHCQVPGQPGRE